MRKFARKQVNMHVVGDDVGCVCGGVEIWIIILISIDIPLIIMLANDLMTTRDPRMQENDTGKDLILGVFSI